MKRLLLLVGAVFFIAVPVQAAYIDLPVSQFASYTNDLPYGNHTMGDSHLGLFPTGSHTVLFTINFSGIASLPANSKVTDVALMTGTPRSFNNPSSQSSGGSCIYLTDDPQAMASASAIAPPAQTGTVGCWQLLFTQPSILSGITPDVVTYANTHKSTFFGGMPTVGVEFDPAATFLRVNYSTTGKTPLSGDANSDGKVNEADYPVLLSHFGQTVLNGPAGGDFNGNGVVDGTDYTIWLKNTSS